MTDLAHEWRQCCLKAIGYEFWNDGEIKPPDDSVLTVQIYNLLPDECMNGVDGRLESEEEEGNEDDDNELDLLSGKDPWMRTAIQIQSNLIEMSLFIDRKRIKFTSFAMKDDEAALIQSTITNFVATTANEIESLSSFISQEQKHQLNSNRQQYIQHCNGIVQVLMNQLKESIMEPFRLYQKQRNRTAIKLWQKPLQCHFPQYHSKKQRQQMNRKGDNRNDDDLSEVLGLNDDDDDDDDLYGFGSSSKNKQQFVPSRPSHRFHQDFYTSYEQERFLTIPPAFPSNNNQTSSIFGKSIKRTNQRLDKSDKDPGSTPDTKTRRFERRPVLTPFSMFAQNKNTESNARNSNQYENQTEKHRNETVGNTMVDPARFGSHGYNNDNEDSYYTDEHQLQQESMLITASLNSDLDSVTQMEQMMTNITTLLSQFAELAQEQQEDVWDINKTTADAKDNVDKGKDQLIDAKERIASSKHYMAKTIAVLGIILLFFNWIVP